ncbi:MAG: CoA-binding protein [Glaciimonas sp.]|nr:CoA-binding protein [Glaciimonas sp.]
MQLSERAVKEINFQQLFGLNRTIAVVGLSAKSIRASYEVASAMQAYGYRIIPVNPMLAGTYILGEYCYATLNDAAAALRVEGIGIDIVDCFRKSDDIPPIADAAIAIGAKVLWMQMGINNESAAAKARTAGLQVVMDRCIKVDAAIYLNRRTQ